MGIESIIADIIKNYGSTGVILAIGIYAIKALMPLVTHAVEQLVKMADSVQKLTLQLAALGIMVTEIRAQQGEIQEDMAGLYTAAVRERPSRRRTAATGD